VCVKTQSVQTLRGLKVKLCCFNTAKPWNMCKYDQWLCSSCQLLHSQYCLTINY